jgi:thiamine-phosphate pyrophosphorylase
VTDDGVLALPDFEERVRSLARSPLIAVHLRSSSLPGGKLLEHAKHLRQAGARIIMNDRVDLIAAGRALGVHLPARGLPVATARQLLGATALIGRSTHDPDEARAASDAGADYVFLGPIWETPSHPRTPGIGLEAIRRAAPARIIAIGGVTPARTPRCLEAGAWGGAAISALWLTGDVAAAADAFLLCLEGR